MWGEEEGCRSGKGRQMRVRLSGKERKKREKKREWGDREIKSK